MSNQVIENLAISLRIQKGIEIKKGIFNIQDHNGISEEQYKYFSDILNTWIRDGSYKGGEIKLPKIGKTLVYQLSSPDKTIVKLTGPGTGL